MKAEVPQEEILEHRGSFLISLMSNDTSPVAQASELQGCKGRWQLPVDQRPQTGYFQRPCSTPIISKALFSGSPRDENHRAQSTANVLARRLQVVQHRRDEK